MRLVSCRDHGFRAGFVFGYGLRKEFLAMVAMAAHLSSLTSSNMTYS
jgi:hypothetical protein